MVQMRYIILGIFIILLLTVTGCATSTEAVPTSTNEKTSANENTNFRVVWSERYGDATGNLYFKVLTKIDIPENKKECYVVSYGESIGMQCYNKS